MTTAPLTLSLGVVALSMMLASSCARSETSATQPGFPFLPTAAPPPPELDLRLVAKGEALYQLSCASCHGADLSGDPNWKTRNPDGSYPPPPQDATGHTWHHSDQLLLGLIRDGSGFEGSKMPKFGGSLGDDEILSILEYLKANWGDEERGSQWETTWRESLSGG